MGLIQNTIEGVGIATISITLKPSLTEQMNVPRAANIRFPYGHPVGPAFEPEIQIQILKDALNLIEKISELASFKEYSDFANTSEIFGSVLTGTKPTSINNQKITSCENGRISMYLLVPEGKSCTVVADKYVDYEEK